MDEFSGGAVRSIEAVAPAFAVDREPARELFVINLCASMTPMTVAKGLAGFEQYKLYQVSRMEDGRRRFRLRLGFFQDEGAAEIVLNAVRRDYPTAFTTCLAEEDLRHAPEGHRNLKPKVVATNAAPPTSPAAKASPSKGAPTTPTRPTASKAPVAPTQQSKTPTTAAPITKTSLPAPNTVGASQIEQRTGKQAAPEPATRTKQNQSAITLSAEPAAPAQPPQSKPHDPNKPTATHSAAALTQASTVSAGIELANDPMHAQPTARAAQAGKPSAPFHVAQGIQVPDVKLQLENEPPSAAPVEPAAPKANAIQRTTATKVNRPSLLDKPLPTAAMMPTPTSTDRGDVIPVLDSTQTIRTLSAAEINDENQPKWYVVQLAISEQPVNLEAMPRLDIFAAYCLYSVAVMEEGSIRHALRLGFFKEEVSADAVSGYLKTFFPTPKIVRISTAEHKRFADPPPRKPESTPDNVVQLEQARDRAHKPAPTQTIAPAPSAANAASATAANKKVTRSVAPAAKHAPIPSKKTPNHMKTGAHRTLGEQLRDEARQVILSQSGVHKQPQRQGSLLSRLVDKLKT